MDIIPKCLKSMKNSSVDKLKTIKYQVKVFEKKYASVFVTASVTDISPLIITSLNILQQIFTSLHMYQLQILSLIILPLIIS